MTLLSLLGSPRRFFTGPRSNLLGRSRRCHLTCDRKAHARTAARTVRDPRAAAMRRRDPLHQRQAQAHVEHALLYQHARGVAVCDVSDLVREHLKNALDKLLPEIAKSEQAAWLRAALPPVQVTQGEARRP